MSKCLRQLLWEQTAIWLMTLGSRGYEKQRLCQLQQGVPVTILTNLCCGQYTCGRENVASSSYAPSSVDHSTTSSALS